MEQFAYIIENWYNSHKRDLPWRRVSDPYLIWISEIILQQTRVIQGYDYFMRFTKSFPTVEALACASEDEVMKVWQGLGYYSRARNLHEAARTVWANGGKFPDTYEGVRALKGVGDYTAAAICSIAYNLPYAVVDGNVYRVLSRWKGLEIPVDTTEGKKIFAKLANDLLDRENPSVYNQALMDFGALQCTPQKPECTACPLATTCEAYKNAKTDLLPIKSHKVKVSVRFFNYIYVRAGEYTYIYQRPAGDIWHNLYEFPMIETEQELNEDELLVSSRLNEWVAGKTASVSLRCLDRNVKHVLSHRVLYATFYELILPEDTSAFAGFERVKVDDLKKYPVSRLIDRFLKKFVFS